MAGGLNHPADGNFRPRRGFPENSGVVPKALGGTAGGCCPGARVVPSAGHSVLMPSLAVPRQARPLPVPPTSAATSVLSFRTARLYVLPCGNSSSEQVNPGRMSEQFHS